MVAFSAAMAGAFRDAEMVAGACHMLDDALWTVVVIGGFAASRGPAEKIIGPKQAGRKCDGRIFRRDGWRIPRCGDGRRSLPHAGR